MTQLVLLVLGFAVLPLVVFRGRTLWRWFAFDAASDLFALALWRLTYSADVDVRLEVALFAAGKLMAFSLVLARGAEVRWSANRAAIVAAVIYALVIPAQLFTPPDGDEPFYLLITESMIKDHDLDLRNQYEDLAHSATRRPDLHPQEGDPVGRHGEQYSRHEPFLPLLLIAGTKVAGLPGALAIVALFGVLLVRSTVRMFEDEGISEETTRAVFPFVAFGPPIVFYAARIWPEVPAAFCFVEAIRGIRQRRLQRWLPALFALVMLKLRFVLVGVVLIGRALWQRRLRKLLVAAMLLLLPLVVVWSVSGSLTNVHSWRELLPQGPRGYAVGLFGLLVDGAAGILVQAPFYLLGVVALARWRVMPESFRIGMAGAALYIVYLIPRSEWHGGWSPPLRYITFLMPILALGAAAVWERLRIGPFVAVAALWSGGLLVHGLAYPWRLFHIADGQNPVGEWLSLRFRSDFSRLFPSFIRTNETATNAAVVLALVLLLFAVVRLRLPVPSRIVIPLLACLVATGLMMGRQPAERIEFEDAHVTHDGGELYPEEYMVARFLYPGGWILQNGQSISFLANAGHWRLQYAAQPGTAITVDGQRIELPPTGLHYGTIAIPIRRGGRVTLKAVAGRVNLDRMTWHE